MADISATVSIVDNFSTPLQAYREELAEATDFTNMITEALKESLGFMQELGTGAIEAGMEVASSLSDVRDSAYDVADAFREMREEMNVGHVVRFAQALLGLVVNLASTVKNAAKAAFEIGKFIFQMNNSGTFFVLRFTTAITKSLVNAYKSAFDHVNKMMSEHMDAINLGEKLEAMHGQAGKFANERMYEMANELGKNAGEVMNAAANAAAQGIGTKDFEDIYRFADKISKLNPGDDATSLAQSLVTNIKSGHDAETLSNMFGGGEHMARQLKYAGYERKLDRGDLQGALDVAKQIAEQAGYTDEKYQKASGTMTENFKFIHNVLGNIKKRLGEIYTRHFEPVVQKIAKMMKSQAFKNFITAIEMVVDRVGAAVGGLIEFLVDHWQILAVAFTAMMLAKGLIIGRIIGIIWRFKGVIFGAGKMVVGLIFKLRGLIKAFLGLGGSAKAGLKALITGNAKWVLIAGVIVGIVKLVQYLVNLTRAEGEEEITVLGILAGGYRFAVNAFTNLFVLLEKLVNRLKVSWVKLKLDFHTGLAWLKTKIAELFDWISDKIKGFAKSKLGQMFIQTHYGIDVSKMSDDTLDAIIGLTSKKLHQEAVDEIVEVGKLHEEINQMVNQETELVDMMEGVEEAMKNPESVLTFLKDLFNIEKKTGEGIDTANKELKKFNEQEEELRWLKTFSDRQITSKYDYSTSYSRNVTFNGMPQSFMTTHGKRELSTMPPRAGL